MLENFRELSQFQMTYYDIITDKINKDCKILFLSDLHSKEYGTDNCKLLASAKEAKPNIILVGGDMIIGRIAGYNEKTVEFIKELSKIAPVYYALGNHEQRMQEEKELYGDLYEQYVSALVDAEVHFLINKTQSIVEENINITGLNIPMVAYEKLKKYDKYSVQDMEAVIGEMKDDTKYNVLLAHNPTYMSIYKQWGADLILAGHFHGCAVRIPGIGGIISPQFHFLPKYSGGCYKSKDKNVIVSRGLGEHTIKVRIFNMPELIVLNLVKEQKF